VRRSLCRKNNQWLAKRGALLAETSIVRVLAAALIALSADVFAGGAGSASFVIGTVVKQSVCTPQQQILYPKACAHTVQSTTVEAARIAKPNPPGSAYPFTVTIDPQQQVVIKTIFI
jgi:hypothetical protein